MRRRALNRAAAAWQDGRPYTAYRILVDAGLGELWPDFRQHALAISRRRYLARLPGPTEPSRPGS